MHKIVTGRQAGFAAAPPGRRPVGLPEPRGERSTTTSRTATPRRCSRTRTGWRSPATLGIDPHRHIVAVIGDGSMTGGMAYEALNNLGHSRRRVIIVLNDNGRCYAPTVSNLSANRQGRDERPVHPSLPDRIDRQAGARRSPTSASTRSTCAASAGSRSSSATLPVVGHAGRAAMEAFKAGVREFLQPPSFFEALGVRYVGPFDGHDIERARARAAQRRRAVGGRSDRRPRPHPEGSGLPAGRGRRREAPPRRAGVRPARRPAEGRADRIHPGVRRGDHQGGRGRPAARRDHRGDARADRPAAVPGPLPRTASSTSASPSSTPSPAPPAWRWAGSARSWPSTRRSSTGRGTRSCTTSRCTGCR